MHFFTWNRFKTKRKTWTFPARFCLRPIPLKLVFPKFDFNKDYSPTTPLQQAEMCQNWQRDLNRSRNVTDVYFLSGTSPKKIRWGL